MINNLAKGLRRKRNEDVGEGYQSIVGIYKRKIHAGVDGVRNAIRRRFIVKEGGT